jgi:hypothetical protein
VPEKFSAQFVVGATAATVSSATGILQQLQNTIVSLAGQVEQVTAERDAARAELEQLRTPSNGKGRPKATKQIA